MVKDPVCNMEVTPDPALMSNYRGENYYFCSADCKRRFDHSPESAPGTTQESLKFRA